MIALICQKRIVVLQSEGHRNAEVGKARANELSGKRENFDGKRKAAELPYDLAGVDHGYDASRCSSNDLFSQQGTASALDRVQTWIDLVGAIDGEVD